MDAFGIILGAFGITLGTLGTIMGAGGVHSGVPKNKKTFPGTKGAAWSQNYEKGKMLKTSKPPKSSIFIGLLFKNKLSAAHNKNKILDLILSAFGVILSTLGVIVDTF